MYCRLQVQKVHQDGEIISILLVVHLLLAVQVWEVGLTTSNWHCIILRPRGSPFSTAEELGISDHCFIGI